MANELRLRSNFLGGLVADNPLSSGATTLTSPGLAAIPAVASTQHFAVTLDPDGRAGAPEVVYITAHTVGTQTATIARGQEGTTARAHERDTVWIHGPTVKDFDASGGGVGLIGMTNFTPASDGAAYNTTSTSVVDIDATNLIVAFTAPPSGKVRVVLAGGAYRSNNTETFWLVRDGSTTKAQQYISSVNGQLHYTTLPLLVTGLTAGTSYSFKWSWKVGSGTAYLYGGPTYGALVMEVWAVNL